MDPKTKLKYLLVITDAIYAGSAGVEVDFLHHDETNDKQSRCHTTLIYLTVGEMFTDKVQLLVNKICPTDSFSYVKYVISLPRDVVIGVSVPTKVLSIVQSQETLPILHELFTLYERLLGYSGDYRLSRLTKLLSEISISDVFDNTVTITSEKDPNRVNAILYNVTTGKHCFEISFYGDTVTYDVTGLHNSTHVLDTVVKEPQPHIGDALSPYIEALTITGYELYNILETYRTTRVGWVALREGEVLPVRTPELITIPDTIPNILRDLGDTMLRPVEVKLSNYLHETHRVTYPLPPREDQDGNDSLVITYENLHPPIMCSRQTVEKTTRVLSTPQVPIIGNDGIYVVSETVFYSAIVNISTTNGVTPIQTSRVYGKSCMFGK